MSSDGSPATNRPSRRAVLVTAGVIAAVLVVAGAAFAMLSGSDGEPSLAGPTSTGPSSAGPSATDGAPTPSVPDATSSMPVAGAGGGSAGGSGGGSGSGGGTGPQLPPASVPPGAAPLPRPTNLVLTALDRSTIRLTWRDNSSDETDFEIFYLVGNEYRFLAGTSAGVTSYVWDTGWGGGYTWCAAVRAARTAMSYTTSEFFPTPPAKVCATTPVPPPPAAPTNLTTTLQATAAILVRWTDNADNETSYWIETSDPNGVMGAHSGRMDPNRTEFNTGSLSAGTRYCFRVRASNDGGDSAWSNTACAETQALPAMPTNVTAEAVDSTTLRVTWVDNSTDETKFEMVVRSDPPGAYGSIKAPAANTTEYLVGNLPAGIRVCVQLRARNLSGGSAMTAWTCADLPPAA